MPSLNDIVEIARALESKPVLVLAERCVAVRKRNASCQRCAEACPTDAVRVANNEVTIDFDACVSCQACATACPMDALVPLIPMEEELITQARTNMQHVGGKTVIACARAVYKATANPETYVEVPCLCRVGESTLVELALDSEFGKSFGERGNGELVLVDGDCATCRFRATQATTDAVVASVNQLLAIWGSSVRVSCTSAFPRACELSQGQTRLIDQISRRHAFEEAGKGAKNAAKTVLAQQLRLGDENAAPTLHDLFAVTDDTSKLMQFKPQRQLRIMDALDRMGEPVSNAQPLETRLWGKVDIDAEACIACGMCATFCPTGAVSGAPESEAQARDCDLVLEHWAAGCTQCGLCADVCLMHCLTVQSRIEPAQLMDFEPRSFCLHQQDQDRIFTTGLLKSGAARKESVDGVEDQSQYDEENH